MKKSSFSAAAAIARQEAQIARGLKHYADQQQRVEGGDLVGYWRAYLAWQDREPVSDQAKVAIMAIRKTIEALTSESAACCSCLTPIDDGVFCQKCIDEGNAPGGNNG